MTTTTEALATTPVRRTLADPVRRILAVDAGICITAGTSVLAYATPIADHAELAAPTAVQVTGAFLLVLGADLALLARAPHRWARLGAAITGVGDVGWAAGSVLLAASAGLPAWATVAVLAQAVLTLAIAGVKRASLASTAR